jgi:3-oxoacyl-[acyl-carrier-protein] synthase-3
MRYNRVSLQGLGYELPPRVVSSAALEDALAPVYEKLRLPAGRLELMSGVQERRFWEPGTRPSEVSVRTARAAIERSGVDLSQIGALVHTSVCRDFLEPATASVVAGQLDLPQQAMVFDISNACLGFMNGLITLSNMVELGQIEAGVVVATEDGGPLVDSTVADLVKRAQNGLKRRDVKPSFASLTIGSGSVAAVVCRAGLVGTPRPLLGGVVRQATVHHELCRSAPDRGFASDVHPLMETDAEAVLTHGCELAKDTWVDFKSELGWTETTPDRLILHQVGSSYRRQLLGALELPDDRDFPTLQHLGNIGSVSLPISLAMAAEAGSVQPGHKVALLGIGSGLNCVMMGTEWA